MEVDCDGIKADAEDTIFQQFTRKDLFGKTSLVSKSGCWLVMLLFIMAFFFY